MKSEKVINIDSNKLQQLINANDCIIVDVREPDEHRAEHIAGSINIPLANISKASLAKLDNKKLVFYCGLGNRSIKASNAAIKYVAQQVLNLESGLASWKKSGRKVKKQGIGFSLMQQVHIVVGFMILLGIILSVFHLEDWLYLSAFFAAGLLFSGLSGWCGMAKLLAFMPWNKIS